jgi:hypothetical protein
MDRTVYEVNLDKMKENLHKSACIVLVFEINLDKLKEKPHKSAG